MGRRALRAARYHRCPRGGAQSSTGRQASPARFHKSSTRFFIRRHLDHSRPGTREAFAGPFARGVDPHLRAEVRQPAGMIERIHRPHHELDIALGIDIIQRLPRHFPHILHIDIFVHHHDAFRKHRLASPPDGVHHFARVSRIRLANRDQDQVMKDALGRHAMSRTSGNCRRISGRKIRSIALPI